jgi:hypothetical protein
MQELNDTLIYDKVANKIQGNVNRINSILANCSIATKLDNQEMQRKFENILNINTESIIRTTPTSEYYDLDKVTKVLEMLDKSDAGDSSKKIRSRAESLTSLHSGKQIN